MVTDIYYNVKNEARKFLLRKHAGRNISEKKTLFKLLMNGSDDMAKSHDLLVMLG